MKTYYTVYQTINNLNNHEYIGLHGTNNLDDGYLGSGARLKRAIKKHGKENFTKQYIGIFDNPHDMISKEVELVDEAFVARADTYNVIRGGGWNKKLYYRPKSRPKSNSLTKDQQLLAWAKQVLDSTC